jgi:hypothetical protein
MDKRSHEIYKACEVSFCWLVILLVAALLLTGCGTTVKHEVPQLDPITQAVQKIVVKDCEKPTLKMRPIAADVVIDIQGDKVTANPGGIALLQDYVKAQKLLKP